MARKNHHLEALKMADAQRKRASLARLQSKKAREKTVEIELPTETGDGTEKVELLFRSIGATEYDRLVTKFPPTSAQRKEGASYNIDLFALPAGCHRRRPQMTDEEARELWNSDAWNRGRAAGAVP
jgi:hypothetical protein